jgi:hypothetical protein
MQYPRRRDEQRRRIGARLAYNAIAINPRSLLRKGLRPRTFAQQHGWLFSSGIVHASSMGGDLAIRVKDLCKLGLKENRDFAHVDGAGLNMNWHWARTANGTVPVSDWLVLFLDIPGGVRGRLRWHLDDLGVTTKHSRRRGT